MLKDINAAQISEYIPLGAQSIMIDYVSEVEPRIYARGYKNFTYCEPFFTTHFPGEPSVPSGVIIDSMSQMLLMTFLTIKGNEKMVTACLKINNAEFLKKIAPGDRLDIESKLDSYNRGIAKGSVVGSVKNEVVSKAEYIIGIPKVIESYKPNIKKEEC